MKDLPSVRDEVFEKKEKMHKSLSFWCFLTVTLSFRVCD